MNDEQATKLAREAALAWRDATGEGEHVYGETCKGLEALLLSVGFDYVVKNPNDWSDSIGGLLSSTEMFHWPIASYNIHQMTAAQIVRGMLLSCIPSEYDRSRYSAAYWQEPRDYTPSYRIADRCADFASFEAEVQSKIKKDKLRKGSKKLAEFYDRERERIVVIIRKHVVAGIERVQAENARKIENIRAEYLPKIERDERRDADIERVLVKLCEAVEGDWPELTKVRAWYEYRRTERTRRMKIVDEHCEYLRKMIPMDPDAIVREGCQGRPVLAPFIVESKG